MAQGAAEPAFFTLPDTAADLCVILVNYNTAHLLDRCLGRLRAASLGLAVRVVIVDNASRDDSVRRVREHFADCLLIANSANVGFGRANNQALAHCREPFVLLLNADAYVFPDTLHKSLAHMAARPRCGVLGVRLTNEALQDLDTGRTFPEPWANFLAQTGLARIRRSPDRAQDRSPPDGAWACDWVVGCYYLTRREVIATVGLFDPRYFLYFEEVDHCRAVKQAGWTVECLADARVIHVGGGSAESEGGFSASGRQISVLQIESELLYFRKHSGPLGLAWVVLLALLTDAIRALKAVRKRRRMDALRECGHNSATVLRLLWQTGLGTRPTR